MRALCAWCESDTQPKPKTNKKHTARNPPKQRARFSFGVRFGATTARAFALYFGYFISPDRGQPFAVFSSDLLHLRWVLCLHFRLALSLTLGGVSHSTYNTRLRCSYIQNKFALCVVLVAFFVSLHLAECAAFFGFPFVSVSVRFPSLSCALSSVFPCSFRVSPLGWCFRFSVPVLRWFLAFGLGLRPADLSRRVSVFALSVFPCGCVSIVSRGRGGVLSRKRCKGTAIFGV